MSNSLSDILNSIRCAYLLLDKSLLNCLCTSFYEAKYMRHYLIQTQTIEKWNEAKNLEIQLKIGFSWRILHPHSTLITEMLDAVRYDLMRKILWVLSFHLDAIILLHIYLRKLTATAKYLNRISEWIHSHNNDVFLCPLERFGSNIMYTYSFDVDVDVDVRLQHAQFLLSILFNILSFIWSKKLFSSIATIFLAFFLFNLIFLVSLNENSSINTMPIKWKFQFAVVSSLF